MSAWSSRTIRSLIEPNDKAKQASDIFWLLNLDQVESHTGKVIEKLFVPIEKIGNSTNFFSKQTVLYSKLRPYLNKVVVADQDGFATSELVPLNCKADVSPYFLAHFLRSPIFLTFATMLVAGAKMPRMVMSEFWNYELNLPSLEEQKRIAAILDQADALRTTQRETLAQLDSLAQAIFVEMFGDPATNSKNWPIKKIGDLLTSASYGTSEKSNETGEFPVLRMNNLTRTGEIDLTDLKYMDMPIADHERYLVKVGDVLFNRTNSADLVGKTAIFRHDMPMAYAGYLIRLRVNAENDPEYLAFFLNTQYSKRMLRAMCKSIIGMANINATEIQAMKTPKPPLDLQQKFAERIRFIEQQKAVQRQQISELNTLFTSLQHRAFRGEL